MGFFDLVDVGLCQWWMWVWDVGLFGLVSLVVCVCVCVFFFFFEAMLVDVGLCRWWPSVFVSVVAVGDDDDDSDR